LSRKKAKQRNKLNEDTLLQQGIQKSLDPGHQATSVQWCNVKFSKHELYPTIWANRNKKPTQKPTLREIQLAYEKIELFHLLQFGRNIICDPKNANEIIAVVKFTKFNDLTDTEKDDFSFLCTFLHRSKKFISPVSLVQRTWGGCMWALGWQKLCDKDQIIGKYIKKFPPEEFHEYDQLFCQSR
jgi:hypothetical protein